MKIIDKTVYCTNKNRNGGTIHYDLRYNYILFYKQLYSVLQTFILFYRFRPSIKILFMLRRWE